MTVKLHATNDKLMPFLHASPIWFIKYIKKMNRKYDINLYRKIIEKLKAANSEIEISSDFIIGYPGETDDFKNT